MVDDKTTTNANDDGTLMVVWNEGLTRNFIMRRYHTGVPVEGSGITVMTGEVDFGRTKKTDEGLWVGYAQLDPESNKFIFTKLKQAKRPPTEDEVKSA